MASPTISYLQQFTNLLVGETENPAKRVDADYINSFGTDLARAMGNRMSSGDRAVDTGGSGIAQTVITLRSDSDRTGQIKAGDWFKVTELATGSAWIGTCSIDDIISFSTLGAGVDGLLVEGAPPAAYNDPAFIDDLRIEIYHQLDSHVQVQQINLTDGDVGALQTNDILRPGGAVLETDMAANEALFLVAHTGAGAPAAGSIETDHFADDAFETFNYDNLLANGGAEVGEAAAGEAPGIGGIGNNPPFYWTAVLGREPDAILITNAQVYEGQYSCEVDYSAGNQAVDLAFNPLDFDVTQHRNKYVALTVAVRATEADSIRVGFNGAAGGEDMCATAGGVAAAWTILTHIMQIDALETALTARFVNDFGGGNVTYVDAAITVLGSKPVGYKKSSWEADAIKASYGSIFDLALNKIFSYWTNGAAVDPDCWYTAGAATCIQEAVAANVARGDFSAHVTIPVGANIFRHCVGYSPTNMFAEALQSRYVTAKFKVKWAAGTRNLHATLRTNVGGNTQTTVIDLPACVNFVPCAVIAFQLNPAATDLYLDFENLDAGAPSDIEFYLDDVQITPTPWPCAPIIPNYWEIEVMSWTYHGSLDPSLADVDLAFGDVYNFAVNNGVQAGFYGVILRGYVECNVGPAVATTFSLSINGGLPVFNIVVTNPATEAQNHVNIPPGFFRVIPSDNLRVYAGAGGSPVEDVVVRVVFLKCAANTSEV